MIYYFAISWPAYGGEDGLSIAIRNIFPGVATAKPFPFFLLVAALALFADRCFVLEKGATVFAGGPGELTPALQDRYLGV